MYKSSYRKLTLENGFPLYHDRILKPDIIRRGSDISSSLITYYYIIFLIKITKRCSINDKILSQ